MDPRAQRQARREAIADRDRERAERGRNQAPVVRWRRARRRIGGWLLELCGPLLVRLLAWTWRVQRIGDAGRELFDSSSPWIVAMWHGRMLPLMPIAAHRHRGLSVLVSPSDDGGLATVALRHFGYRIVRGSLSRGGARALREMRQLLAAGQQLVVTPDGPRGPRHSVNAGAAWLARATGAPLVPLGVAASRAWRLRSWDRFAIPKPFARLLVVYGEPLFVPGDADDAAVETATANLRQQLIVAELRGFAQLRLNDDLELDHNETRTPAANSRQNERDSDTPTGASEP